MKILKSLLIISGSLLLVAVSAVYGFVLPTYAIARSEDLCGTDLQLDWEDPFFDVDKFVPGNRTTAVLTVSNTSVDTTHTLGLEFLEQPADPGDINNEITLKFERSDKDKEVTYSLAELYNKGEFAFTELAPEDGDVTITFTADFSNVDEEYDESGDNNYQGRKTEFDIVLGCYGEEESGGDDEGVVLGASVGGLPATGRWAAVLFLSGAFLLIAGLLLKPQIRTKKKTA